MDGVFPVLTLFAALGSGVMTGIFFTFSVFMMKALKRLPPAQAIVAMQSINVTILNPLFLLTFMGTGVASVVLAVSAFREWSEPGAAWLLAGSVLYLVGSILVTSIFNVPRNDSLAALDPNSANAAQEWTRYMSAWTSWNHVRTVLTLASTLAFIVAVAVD